MQVYICSLRTRDRHRTVARERARRPCRKSRINVRVPRTFSLDSKFVNSESTNRTKRLTLLLRHRVSREETRKGFSSEFPRGDILYFSKGTVPERKYVLRNAGSTATLFHRSPSTEHRFVSLCLGCARVPTNKHWLVTAL